MPSEVSLVVNFAGYPRHTHRYEHLHPDSFSSQQRVHACRIPHHQPPPQSGNSALLSDHRGPHGTASLGANFTHKHAMKLLDAPNFLLLLQLLTVLSIVYTARACKWVHTRPFSWQRCRHLLPLSIAYALHAALVLRSLAILNIAIYNTLKRTTPIMVLAAKVVMDRRLPELREACAVALVVSGCVIAGAGDLSFDPVGYALALFCASLQATYILLTEAAEEKPGERSLTPNESDAELQPLMNASSDARSAEAGQAAQCSYLPYASGSGTDFRGGGAGGKMADKETFKRTPPLKPTHSAVGALSGFAAAMDVLMYLPVNTIPLATVAWLVSNEANELGPSMLSAQAALGSGFVFAIWLSVVAVAEFALTGTLVWCTQSNSALTTTIVGVLKSALAVPLGILFMAGGATFGFWNIVGMVVVTLGGSWYT
eukprot:gene15564-21661_t